MRVQEEVQLICSVCKKDLEEPYYQCKKHKIFFCYRCLSNNGHREVDIRRSNHCRVMPEECIYNRIEEKEEDG